MHAANVGLCMKEEALAAVTVGTLPTSLQGIVDGMSNDDAKWEAKMQLGGSNEFYRRALGCPSSLRSCSGAMIRSMTSGSMPLRYDALLAAMKASIGPKNLACSAMIFSSLHSHQRIASKLAICSSVNLFRMNLAGFPATIA